MKIGGMQKFSLIDYPGKIACVLGTQGCYFRCPFCHNPLLVLPEQFVAPLRAEEILAFLETRKKQLQAVVVSGGEPTMQKDLPFFIQKIKEMGYLVKLDTSGINPTVLELLLSMKTLDYVAMDIKAPIEKYPLVTGVNLDFSTIQRSIDLLCKSGIDFEFRSTLVPKLHTKKDLLQMVKLIEGAP